MIYGNHQELHRCMQHAAADPPPMPTWFAPEQTFTNRISPQDNIAHFDRRHKGQGTIGKKRTGTTAHIGPSTAVAAACSRCWFMATGVAAHAALEASIPTFKP
jgi:hypothetical protein